MTGPGWADGRAAPFASIGWAALHSFALIALAMLLILVLLPAVLGAAGIHAVVAA